MEKILRNRYIGALLGASIGDALGWPNEQNSNNIGRYKEINGNFLEWKRRSGGRYWPYEEKIKAGEYSDDTQLLIATLRSLIKKEKWSSNYRQVELPAWLVYERGGGGATKRAATCWAKGFSPWDDKKNTPQQIERYFTAGGNGVAMRIMPHVFGDNHEIEAIMKQVLLNGMYTHGHPRALVGALLYAYGLQFLFSLNQTLEYGQLIDFLLINRDKWGHLPQINNLESWVSCAKLYAKMDYVIEWGNVVEETVQYLNIAKENLNLGILDIGDETLAKLGCFDKKINGAGNITSVISIYLFSKYASDPQKGILEAVNLKNSDTDTIASMMGGLIGAIYGENWIPLEYRVIQDYDIYEVLVDKLLKDQDNIVTSNNTYRLFNKELLSNMEIGESSNVLPFGSIKLLEKRNEKVYGKDMYATTFICKASYGQTIFVTKVGKITANYTTENKDSIEKKPSSVVKNTLLLGRTGLQEIRKILKNIHNTDDFIVIIDTLWDMVEKEKKLTKNDIKMIQEGCKDCKVNKKQIDSVYALLKNSNELSTLGN